MKIFYICAVTSPIHKAAGSLVTGRSLQNGKMSMGNHHTERPPDPVLYGGRPSGGFVNSAVRRFIYILLFVHVCSALLLSIAIAQVCVLRSPLFAWQMPMYQDRRIKPRRLSCLEST